MVALICSFVFTPFATVHAQQQQPLTIEQLQAMLAALQAQVAQVEAQIAQMGGGTVPVEKPTVTIPSTKLSLEYDSKKKESALVSGFKVQIKAGKSPVMFSSSSFPVYAETSDVKGGASMYVPGEVTAATNITRNGDNYTVAPGKTSVVTVRGKFNPKIMFGGTYTARIPAVTFDTYKVDIGSYKTNAVTIVGEVSPYITSVVATNVDDLVHIKGVRFASQGNIVHITDGKTFSKEMILSSANGEIIFHPGKSGIPAGYYTLWVKNPTVEGLSNNYFFQIQGSNTTTSGISVGDSRFSIDYDSQRKENFLLAQINFKISAGKENLVVLKSGAVSINATGSKDQGTSYPRETNYRLVSGAADMGDHYLISSGSTASFNANATWNPKVMFAGAYTAKLNGIMFGHPTSGSTYFVQAPANNSNQIVIVGEVSPYITSITQSVLTASSTVVIGGVRFASTGNTVKIWNGNGTEKTFTSNPNTNGAISFVPVRVGLVSAGTYFLSITHPTTGQSNVVSFRIEGGNVQQPTISFQKPYSAPTPITAGVANAVLGHLDIITTEKDAVISSLDFGISVNGDGGNLASKQMLVSDVGLYDGTVLIAKANTQLVSGRYPIRFENTTFRLAPVTKTLTIRGTVTNGLPSPSPYEKPMINLIFTGVAVSSDHKVNYSLLELARITVEGTPTIPTPLPKVTVLSPNGGETYYMSSVIPVKWTTQGLDSSAKVTIALKTVNGDGSYGDTVLISSTLNDGSETVNMVEIGKLLPLPLGKQKIEVRVLGNEKISDMSDNAFELANTQSTPPKVVAAVSSANENKAGVWGVFGPGVGNSGTALDWKWNASLTAASARNIKSIVIENNNKFDRWSTVDEENYPLVVFIGGKQVNTAYDQVIQVPAGTTNIVLYGQVETRSFAGGKIIVTFGNDEQISAPIAASAIKVANISPEEGTNMAAALVSLSGLLEQLQSIYR